MKNTLALLFAFLFPVMVFAQQSKPFRGPMPKDEIPKVEKMVSNLTAIQKNRIENITEKTKKEVSKLKNELHAIRIQIGGLNSKEGDQSSILFPLFDRESQIMAEISKEMYRCRLQIDEVLTPEQLKEFRNSLEKERQKQMHGKDQKPKMEKKSGFDAKPSK